MCGGCGGGGRGLEGLSTLLPFRMIIVKEGLDFFSESNIEVPDEELLNASSDLALLINHVF